jgi:hypothetical protein
LTIVEEGAEKERRKNMIECHNLRSVLYIEEMGGRMGNVVMEAAKETANLKRV